jgi:hypothetical protein
MQKYSTLKSLAEIVNLIAVLNLIAGIIIAIYFYNENLGIIVIASSVIIGLIGFVLLLSFGKLIQITYDIRENQIYTKEQPTSIEAVDQNLAVNKDNKDVDFLDSSLFDLRKLILNQKQSFFTNNKHEILEILSRLVSTKQKGLDLITAYENKFGVKIIDELKSLSSNYGTVKEYLNQFIKFEIVENEYPHKII